MTALSARMMLLARFESKKTEIREGLPAASNPGSPASLCVVVALCRRPCGDLVINFKTSSDPAHGPPSLDRWNGAQTLARDDPNCDRSGKRSQMSFASRS